MSGTITIIKDELDIFAANSNPKAGIDRLTKALKHYHSLSNKSEAKLQELENNQKWLMKQNNELQAGLRSIYAFMEHLPAPIVIIQLPSRKYEFANKSFLRKFNLSKDDIKNKTDDDIFKAEDADMFATKVVESIDTLKLVKVSSPNFYARQIVMTNNNNQPTHILRIFS